jgi:nitrogen regulatory protein PII
MEVSVVKKVEAIITPEILETVRGVFDRCGCHEILLSEVRISRHDSASASGHYRGNTYDLDLPKIKVEAIVSDADTMPAAQAILHTSHYESGTDTKVSVCALEQVVSIGVSAMERKEFGEFEQILPQRSSRAERLHA